jgi:hypothetical protein
MLGAYQEFKESTLGAGVKRLASLGSVETALLIGSLGRRYIEQILQTVVPLQKLIQSEDGMGSLSSDEGAAFVESDNSAIGVANAGDNDHAMEKTTTLTRS